MKEVDGAVSVSVVKSSHQVSRSSSSYSQGYRDRHTRVRSEGHRGDTSVYLGRISSPSLRDSSSSMSSSDSSIDVDRVIHPSMVHVHVSSHRVNGEKSPATREVFPPNRLTQSNSAVIPLHVTSISSSSSSSALSDHYIDVNSEESSGSSSSLVALAAEVNRMERNVSISDVVDDLFST